jgi:methyltransferase (TIGR00027 family)
MALFRAHESQRVDRLFNDPLAKFIAAALADTPELDEVAADHGVTAAALGKLLDSAEFRYFSVRTRYFDDRLRSAMDSGIRQVVSLAAGLDGRPTRLCCPPGTHWFEVDLPEITAVKAELLNQAGLTTSCARYGVVADLTLDWPSPLQDAGFEPGQPTVWLVEGLLMYLPTDVADRLLAEITRLSIPGSQLLLEHLNTRMLIERTDVLHRAAESQNNDFQSARDDLAPWLARFGWRTEVHAGSDPLVDLGRGVPDMPAAWLAHGFLDGPSVDERSPR